MTLGYEREGPLARPPPMTHKGLDLLSPAGAGPDGGIGFRRMRFPSIPEEARMRRSLIVALALLALAFVAIPAGATTLVRQGLDRLTAENEMVVHGRVLDIHSYWNDDHTFILTDVRVRPSQVIKGSHAGDVTLTVMGGTVGELSSVIIAGADLAAGDDYVLFLNRVDLPGAANRLTVRDLAQGAFNVVKGRAISQALGHALLPDAQGRTQVPGGEEGLALDELVRQVRQNVNR